MHSILSQLRAADSALASKKVLHQLILSHQNEDSWPIEFCFFSDFPIFIGRWEEEEEDERQGEFIILSASFS